MIKLILWDIDGTLTDFEKAEKIGIKNCFDKFELGECTKEMIEDYSEINARYWKMLERKEITKPRLLVERFDVFFKKYDIECDTKKFNEAYQEELRNEVCLQPGAKKTVSEIKKLNIPQYVVTNGLVESQNKKLKNVRLSSYFEKVFISDEIGHDKPTVEFFEPVLKDISEKYPDIKKDEMLIIGDSLSSDIQGGINIGIKTCWFNPKHKEKEIEVDFEVDKLVNVLDLLKEEEKEEEQEQELKEVEGVEVESTKVSFKDVIDHNYKVIIMSLAAIALLFICLFIGTNNKINKSYTLDELFMSSGYEQTITIPGDWYLSSDGQVFELKDSYLKPTMYGYIVEIDNQSIAESFEAIRQQYYTEDLICGGYNTLFIKYEENGTNYDYAYMVIPDKGVLCISFVNVDQKVELKILNSIK